MITTDIEIRVIIGRLDMLSRAVGAYSAAYHFFRAHLGQEGGYSERYFMMQKAAFDFERALKAVEDLHIPCNATALLRDFMCVEFDERWFDSDASFVCADKRIFRP